jgi:hypothetical protein
MLTIFPFPVRNAFSALGAPGSCIAAVVVVAVVVVPAVVVVAIVVVVVGAPVVMVGPVVVGGVVGRVVLVTVAVVVGALVVVGGAVGGAVGGTVGIGLVVVVVGSTIGTGRVVVVGALVVVGSVVADRVVVVCSTVTLGRDVVAGVDVVEVAGRVVTAWAAVAVVVVTTVATVGSVKRLVVGFRLVVVTEVGVLVDRVVAADVVVVVSFVVDVTAGPPAGVEGTRVVVLGIDEVVEAVVPEVRLVPPAVVVVVPSFATVVLVTSPPRLVDGFVVVVVVVVVLPIVVVVEAVGLAGIAGISRPGRSAKVVVVAFVVVVVGSGSGSFGKSTRMVVVVVGGKVVRVTIGSSLRGATVVTRAGRVVVSSSFAFVVVVTGASAGGVIGEGVGVTRCGVVVEVVVLVVVLVVDDVVEAALGVELISDSAEVVGVLSDVVGGTVDVMVGSALAGRVANVGARVVVVVLVLVVLVVVVGTVRGGAVSVIVVVPPPRTPPVVPSGVPRLLVMTEPSGRMMIRPSVPPGLIQIRCSSTVTSIGPVPGMAMVWMIVPFALRTIICRVRSLRKYTRRLSTMGAAVNALGSLRSTRCGVASPFTRSTTPALLESTGTRSPVTYCSGTLIAPSFGVSDLATITPLRTRVIRPGSITKVSLLFVTTRAVLARFVTATREVSFVAPPLSLDSTATSSPAVVSTWRPRPLSTATSAIADPISTVSPEALSRVGSNNETLPDGSSATNVRLPATPTWILVVGNCIETPSAPATLSMGSTAPFVWSCTTGFAPPSCLIEYSVPLN